MLVTFGRLQSGRHEDGKPHTGICCRCIHYTLQFVKSCAKPSFVFCHGVMFLSLQNISFCSAVSSRGSSTHTRTCHGRASLDPWIGPSRLCWVPIIISHGMQGPYMSIVCASKANEHRCRNLFLRYLNPSVL